MKSTNLNMLMFVEPETTGGEIICRRLSTPYYITDDCSIGDIAELFTVNSSLRAIGVIDREGRAAGIIMKNDLLSLIGQRYGRELYINRSIREIIRSAGTVYYKRSTFSVIDELSEELRSPDNRFYVLTDAENMYRGLICTFDLVLFLSEMMTRELKAARRVHSAIVKENIEITSDRLSLCGSLVMAGETGGDLHYVRDIGDNRRFISLCDVSGKGLNAGLISVAVSSMCAAYDYRNGIEGLIRIINSYIFGLFGGEIFMTGVFIELDESTGRMNIYDMGHSMIYIIRDNRAAAPDKCGNMPLGITKEVTPSRAEVTLGSGDMVLSYTDGLPEQNNLLKENFGEERILSLVTKYRNSGLDRIINIVFEEIKSWRFGNSQEDDISMLILRYR